MNYFSYFRVFHRLMRNKSHTKNLFSFLASSRTINHLILPINLNDRTCFNTKVYREAHTDIDEDENEDYPLLETEYSIQEERVKYILFKNSNDVIMKELDECTSIGEIWSVMKKHRQEYKEQHLAQTILVLGDLQNMFTVLKPNAPHEFLTTLQKYPEFNELLVMIQDCLTEFNPTHLSYVLLYLHKLGISIETEFMQRISTELCNELCANFCIDRCSKLLTVLFSENSIRPYFIALKLIPIVFNFIGNCNSSDDLQHLTISLNKLHQLVTNEILTKYTRIVEYFIESSKLNSKDHKTILSIIRFLHYPEWRYKTSLLTSNCMLMLKDEITSLDLPELLILYEVFFKCEEPGDILNEIQRSAAKFWQNCEEGNSYHIDTNLKIFSALIYFSSPLQRFQFKKDIYKFMQNCDSYERLVLLRKIFSYVKVSDERLCGSYWNSSMKVFKNNYNIPTAVKLCQNYMHFNTNIDNYKHDEFERMMFMFIAKMSSDENVILPSELTAFLAFTILYGKSEHLIDRLLKRFEENLTQIKAIDCLKVSHSVGTSSDSGNSVISKQQLMKINTLLKKRAGDIVSSTKTNYNQNSVLIKASILRNEPKHISIDNLIMEYKGMSDMSSKMIENLSFIFLSTDILIPEVINKCTEYILNHNRNVIGFNAEKMLFLCYYLAYYPINADKFFQVVTDIIIRDQERLSSLGFLQSALCLSFFNKLPSFLVKQIFNVEFMDKLDNELANCYSKDKYSQRVRNTLMYLNRTVCLEYPEFNIPWFHEKYLREIEKRFENEPERQLPSRIKEYLIQITGHPKYILQNLVTPYGYHVDFVISLNKENKIVLPDSLGISRKIALLLTKKHAFTRFYIHLKGKHQMKRRHLEILGYTVSLLNVNEWVNLLYSEERLDYLNTLIWPKKKEMMREKTVREPLVSRFRHQHVSTRLSSSHNLQQIRNS